MYKFWIAALILVGFLISYIAYVPPSNYPQIENDFITQTKIDAQTEFHPHEEDLHIEEDLVAKAEADLDLMREEELITQTESESDQMEKEIEVLLKETEHLPSSSDVPSSTLTNEISPDSIEAGNASQAETFPVIFRAFQRAIISSRITSTVLKIPKRMGERFRQGDLLIELDDIVFKGLEQKALGLLAKAEAELSSKKELYRHNIASLYEIKTAEANVAEAKSDLINARYSIEACHIMAPYDGKVVALLVEEYELIQEGKPLIEIVDDTELIGQVLAPATYFAKIYIGQPLKIYVQETRETVPGKILRIDAVIDPASSLLKLDILVDNRESKLRAGMIGQTVLEPESSNASQAPPVSQPQNR